MKNTLLGSKIALFAVNITINKNTNIDASGKGCTAKFGKGKGIYYDNIHNCSSHGAHHAGYGGIGLPFHKKWQDIENNMYFCLKYFQISNYVLNNGPYSLDKEFFSGSGGSCFKYIEGFNQLGEEGAGGGCVIVNAVN